jgi:arabinogalactan oligomer/maltooligosaccharide transport system substrate-binding protein
MTSDNGYFMYYDKSIISEKDAESLEKIIEKCEANGKKIYFNIEDAWYTSSFFFATGCNSEWTIDDDGNFIGIYDNFNSAEGLIAMKGMSKLAKSSCYTKDANTFTDIAVIISGIWEANAASAYYGNNLAATDLPSFEVDGKSYHLGSYSGNKLLGVKPQADAKKTAVLSKLAQYLTGEECQRERYESFQWGPSNKTVQGSEAVQSNIFLSALAKQNKYGVPQGQIDGSWWDIAKVLGTKARIAKNDNELKLALNEYESAVNAIFKKSEAEKNAWGVIGNICNTNWDTDFPMTEGPTGTFTSDVLELKAGEEFKVRKGASWDVNFGDEFNGANIVVKADGKYKVQFIWNGDKVGIITLIPTE